MIKLVFISIMICLSFFISSSSILENNNKNIKYEISSTKVKEGDVFFNLDNAKANDLIKVNTKANPGYKVKRMYYVNDLDNNQIVEFDNEFKMPNFPITVYVDFEEDLTIEILEFKNVYYSDELDFDLTNAFIRKDNKVISLTSELIKTRFDKSIGKHEAIIEYEGVSRIFRYEVIQLEVTSLEKLEGVKTNYYKGDSLVLDNAKASVIFNNGKKEEIEIDSSYISNFDTSSVGNKEMIITIMNREFKLSYDVIYKPVKEILAVSGINTSYYKEESLVINNPKISVKYYDDTLDEIDISYDNISDFSTSSVGEKEMIISFLDKTYILGYEVNELVLLSIDSIKGISDVYYLGDELDVVNIKANIKYKNGVSKEISIRSEDVSGFDTSEVGIKNMVISIDGVNYTHQYEVKEDKIKRILAVSGINTSYYKRVNLILNDPKIKVSYNSGKVLEVNINLTNISGFDSSSPGNKIMKITYENIIYFLDYEVKNDEVMSIEYIEGIETNYYVGGKLVLNNPTILVTYNTGMQENVIIDDTNISDFNLSFSGEYTMSINYMGKSISLNYLVKEDEIIGIDSVKGINTTYYEGDKIVLNDPYIIVNYHNKQERINIDETNIKWFNSVSSGNRKMSIIYNGFSYELSYTVRELNVVSINSVSGLNDIYYRNDDLNINDILVNVTYNSGVSRDIHIGLKNVVGFDTSSLGIKRVVISIDESSYTCSYNVLELEISEIVSVTSNNIYYVGDSIDINDFDVKVKYNNNSIKSVDITINDITNFNSDSIGEYTMTIYVGELSYNLTYIVKNLTIDSINSVSGVKNEYYLNDVLELNNASVNARLDNGKERNIAITKDNIVGFDTSSSGNKTMIVSVLDNIYYLSYVVYEIKVSQILEVTGIEDTYYINNILDINNIIVRVRYNNDKEDTIGVSASSIKDFDTSTTGDKEMNISIDEGVKTISYNVSDKKIISINQVIGLKDTYYEQDLLDIENIILNVTYSDESVRLLKINSENISGFNTGLIGNNTMTISVFESTYTHSYNVVEVKALEIIEVTGVINNYYVGDSLIINDGKIKVRYNNGKGELIDITGSNITGFDTISAGSKQMSITYLDLTYSYDYVVNEVSLVSILGVNNLNSRYYTNDSLQLEGVTITLGYNNNSSNNVSISEDNIQGFDTTQAGSKIMVISYEGKSYNFSYDVIELRVREINSVSGIETTYYKRDSVVLNNAKAYVTYNNDVSDYVDLDVTNVYNFFTNEIGNKKMTIVYDGVTYLLDYVVNDIVIDTIDSVHGIKTTYLLNEELELNDAYIMVTYTIGRTGKIDITSENISGFTSFSDGSYVMKVSIEGKEYSIDYVVKEINYTTCSSSDTLDVIFAASRISTQDNHFKIYARRNDGNTRASVVIEDTLLSTSFTYDDITYQVSFVDEEIKISANKIYTLCRESINTNYYTITLKDEDEIYQVLASKNLDFGDKINYFSGTSFKVIKGENIYISSYRVKYNQTQYLVKAIYINDREYNTLSVLENVSSDLQVSVISVEASNVNISYNILVEDNLDLNTSYSLSANYKFQPIKISPNALISPKVMVSNEMNLDRENNLVNIASAKTYICDNSSFSFSLTLTNLSVIANGEVIQTLDELVIQDVAIFNKNDKQTYNKKISIVSSNNEEIKLYLQLVVIDIV